MLYFLAMQVAGLFDVDKQLSRPRPVRLVHLTLGFSNKIRMATRGRWKLLDIQNGLHFWLQIPDVVRL